MEAGAGRRRERRHTPVIDADRNIEISHGHRFDVHQDLQPIRDRFAFHADKEPVLEWLNARPPLEGVGVMAQFGPHVEDIVFDTAAFAVFDATEKLLTDGFEKTIGDVVFAIPRLIEGMVRGAVVNWG